MSLRNTELTYGSVAKFFHSVIAVLVIGMLIFGFCLDQFSDEMKPLVYNIHKLIGLSILFLMILRLWWAFINPKPALPANTKPWEHSVERAVHGLLYLLVILMPLAGWVGSVAAGRPPHLGEVAIGLPVPISGALSSSAFMVHGRTAVFLIVLISLHALAALFHHFVKKDNILRRMMPWMS